MTPSIIPPWMHGPPDPARILLESQRIGAEIAAQRARLQQQAQLEQIRLELEQEREDRQSRQRQQELEIQKSYDDQQVALKQQALDEDKKRIDSQVQAARQKYDAIQGYQKAVTPIEQGGLGMSQQDAILQFGPAMSGASGSTVSAMLRDARMANSPRDLQAGNVLDPSGNPIPGMAAIGGHARNLPRVTAPKLSEKDHFEAVDLTKQIEKAQTELQTKLSAVDPTDPEEQRKLMPLRDRMLELKRDRNELFQKQSKTGPNGLPLPQDPTEKNLLNGQIYATPKGLAQWDADKKHFKVVPPEQVTPATATESQTDTEEDPEHPADEP